MDQVKNSNRYGVPISAMLVQLCVGIIYMWSVFSQEIVKKYGIDSGDASYNTSIMLGAFVIGILVGGRIQDRIGPKIVAIAGSILFSIGIFSTSFVLGSGIYAIYLLYGVVAGIGVGAAYTSTISCCQKWFPDKKGFATGMVVSAFGFSVVVFAPVAEWLMGAYGIESTFRILAILFFVVCILASLFIHNPPEGYRPKGFTPSQVVLDKKQYTTREMLKKPVFYYITVSMMLATPAYFILNPLLKQLGEARGLSPELALAGLMITGIASASGRLICPWISDKIGRKMAIISIIALTLICSVAMIWAGGVMFLVLVAAIAFAYGGYSGVYPALTSDIFGSKYIGANYGCVMVGFGISAIVFPFIAKEINKTSATDAYFLPFIIAAAVCVIAIVLVFPIKPAKESNAAEK